MPFPFTPRRLAVLTAVSAVLVTWTLADRSLLAIPLSVVFVLAAFGWSLSRIHVEALEATGGFPVPPDDRICTGCRAGCVGCRERIDAPA